MIVKIYSTQHLLRSFHCALSLIIPLFWHLKGHSHIPNLPSSAVINTPVLSSTCSPIFSLKLFQPIQPSLSSCPSKQRLRWTLKLPVDQRWQYNLQCATRARSRLLIQHFLRKDIAFSSMAVDLSNTVNHLPLDLHFDLLCLFLSLHQKHWQHQPLPSRKKKARIHQSINDKMYSLLCSFQTSAVPHTIDWEILGDFLYLTRCGCAARVQHPVGARRA